MPREYLEELKKLLEAYPDEVNVCGFSFVLGPKSRPTVFVVHNTEGTQAGLWVFTLSVHFTRRIRPFLLDGYITCLREGCNKRVVPLESSKDANAKDGGIARGFGAFTAYQVTSSPSKNEYPRLLTYDKVAHSECPPW